MTTPPGSRPSPPPRPPASARAGSLLAGLAVAAAAVLGAGATTTPGPELEAALSRTEEAALVRVVAVESEWRGRRLATRVRGVAQDAERPGPAGGARTDWLHPGGAARDPLTGLAVRLVVPGQAPPPRPGDELVVLLARRGGERVLADPLLGAIPAFRDGAGRALCRLPGRREPVPASEILTRAAGAPGRRPPPARANPASGRSPSP